MTFGLGNRCSVQLSYGTSGMNPYFKIRLFESASTLNMTIRLGGSNCIVASIFGATACAAGETRIYENVQTHEPESNVAIVRQQCANWRHQRAPRLFLLRSKNGILIRNASIDVLTVATRGSSRGDAFLPGCLRSIR